MSNHTFDVTVIGAGIVGLSTAREIVNRFPGSSVLVVEKEPQAALHQTGRNSGVIHSGLYYKPGSLKATLCVSGAREMIHFCREQGLPLSLCGKLVVATSESEFPALQTLFERGVQNGVAGLRILTSEEMKEFEPHAAGKRGLHVPETAITDYRIVANRFADLASKAGAVIAYNAEVIGLSNESDAITINTTAGEFRTRLLVNCAGLFSDRIRHLAGGAPEVRIVPFRGEYYEIVPQRSYLVKSLIYPVPDPRFPFLGVHFTRRVGGKVDAGPNAVLALKREGYSRTSISARDTFDTLSFGGFWKMARTHWRSAAGEYYRSFSKAAFVEALQRLVPEITESDLRESPSGVRAQALEADGQLVDDFRFIFTERMIHVCNVPSPAATASIVIARHIVNEIEHNSAFAKHTTVTVPGLPAQM